MFAIFQSDSGISFSIVAAGVIAIGIVVLVVVFAPLWGCAFDLIYWLKGKRRRGER